MRIFLAVGHQMPFDRLVRAVDAWAAEHEDVSVFGQIGDAEYAPEHFPSVAHVAPDDFRHRVAEADALVAHAGMGTIIDALRLGKPMLVLPRLARLGETRSDHQVATARHFADAGYLLAARDEAELVELLPRLGEFRPRATIDGQASAELLARLREFAFAA